MPPAGYKQPIAPRRWGPVAGRCLVVAVGGTRRPSARAQRTAPPLIARGRGGSAISVYGSGHGIDGERSGSDAASCRPWLDGTRVDQGKRDVERGGVNRGQNSG
jgi:hypothetical protein